MMACERSTFATVRLAFIKGHLATESGHIVSTDFGR